MSNSTRKFGLGWPYGFVTRDGRKARVLSKDIGGERPIVVLVKEEDGEETPYSYTKKGNRNIDGTEDPLDLFNAEDPYKLEYDIGGIYTFWCPDYYVGSMHWVCIKGRGCMYVFYRALTNAKPQILKCIGTVPVWGGEHRNEVVERCEKYAAAYMELMQIARRDPMTERWTPGENY